MKKVLLVMGLICLLAFFVAGCNNPGNEAENKAVSEPAKEVKSDAPQAGEAKSGPIEETLKDEAATGAEKAKEAAAGTVEAAKEAVSGAVEAGKEAASAASNAAANAAAAGKEAATDAAQAVKEKLETAAEKSKE